MSSKEDSPDPKPTYVGPIDWVKLTDGSELRQDDGLSLFYDGHLQMLTCVPADESVGTSYIPLARIERMNAFVRRVEIDIPEEEA